MTGEKCETCDLKRMCEGERVKGDTSRPFGIDTYPCDQSSSRKTDSLTVGFRRGAAPQGRKAVADIVSGLLTGVEAPLSFELALEMPDGTEHKLGAVKARNHSKMASTIYSHFGFITPVLGRHGNHCLKVTARDNKGIVHAEGSGRVEVKDCG